MGATSQAGIAARVACRRRAAGGWRLSALLLALGPAGGALGSQPRGARLGATALVSWIRYRSKTIVTGPSLRISSCIRSPKMPVSTRMPNAANASQNAS